MKIEYHGAELLSPALQEICEKKVEKLEKFNKNDFKMDLYLGKETKNYTLKAVLTGKVNTFVANAKSDDMYKNVDLVVNNLKDQLSSNKLSDGKKHKTRLGDNV